MFISSIFNSNNSINEFELNIESTLSLETLLENHTSIMNDQIELESSNTNVPTVRYNPYPNSCPMNRRATTVDSHPTTVRAARPGSQRSSVRRSRSAKSPSGGVRSRNAALRIAEASTVGASTTGAFKGRDGTLWSKNQNYDPSNLAKVVGSYDGRPRIKPELVGLDKHQFFDYLINDTMVSLIVKYTNQRIKEPEKPVSVLEIRAFFGLLLLFGAMGKRDVEISELWSPMSNHHLHLATAAMPRSRFQFIATKISFDDLQQRYLKLMRITSINGLLL